MCFVVWVVLGFFSNHSFPLGIFVSFSSQIAQPAFFSNYDLKHVLSGLLITCYHNNI